MYIHEKEKSCTKLELDIHDEIIKCLTVHKNQEVDTHINMTSVFNSQQNYKERVIQSPLMKN